MDHLIQENDELKKDEHSDSLAAVPLNEYLTSMTEDWKTVQVCNLTCMVGSGQRTVAVTSTSQAGTCHLREGQHDLQGGFAQNRTWVRSNIHIQPPIYREFRGQRGTLLDAAGGRAHWWVVVMVIQRCGCT